MPSFRRNCFTKLLILGIPRNLIDAKIGGEDIDFVVTALIDFRE